MSEFVKKPLAQEQHEQKIEARPVVERIAEPVGSIGRPWWRNWKSLAAGAAAAMVMAGGIWLLRTGNLPVARSIAVLPFESIGGDLDFDSTVQGFSDSLTNDLSNLEAAQKSLWVVPSSAVRGHKVSDAATAFRELGATMAVEGVI